jgi:hypothetical protein
MAARECLDCTRTPNNRYFNCPPIMADGRHFTDYRPRCDINYLYPRDQAVSSYDYRMYLTHQAEQLMAADRAATYRKNVCGPCVEPYAVGTMLPEQTKVICNAQSCRIVSHDPRGVGQGRQHVTVEDPGFEAQKAAFYDLKRQEQAAAHGKYAACCQ